MNYLGCFSGWERGGDGGGEGAGRCKLQYITRRTCKGSLFLLGWITSDQQIFKAAIFRRTCKSCKKCRMYVVYKVANSCILRPFLKTNVSLKRLNKVLKFPTFWTLEKNGRPRNSASLPGVRDSPRNPRIPAIANWDSRVMFGRPDEVARGRWPRDLWWTAKCSMFFFSLMKLLKKLSEFKDNSNFL